MVAVTLPLETDKATAHQAWKVLRDLVPQTQAWPILTGGDQLNMYMDHKPYLRLGATVGEISTVAHTQPTRRSTKVHEVRPEYDWPAPDWLPLLEDPPRMPDNGEPGPESLHNKADFLQEKFGTGPTAKVLADALGPDGKPITDIFVAERWIHDWTMANLDQEQILQFWSAQRRDLVDLAIQDSRTIVLLAYDQPEAAAALDHYRLHGRSHMHMLLARLIQDWHILWGAEPVLFQLVSLAFHVERPPTTIAEALPLAIELAAIGPSTLEGPGFSIYEYASTLVGATTWDLLDLP